MSRRLGILRLSTPFIWLSSLSSGAVVTKRLMGHFAFILLRWSEKRCTFWFLALLGRQSGRQFSFVVFYRLVSCLEQSLRHPSLNVGTRNCFLHPSSYSNGVICLKLNGRWPWLSFTFIKELSGNSAHWVKLENRVNNSAKIWNSAIIDSKLSKLSILILNIR